MVTVLPVLIGLLSAALLARGLRGRRVGREPFCPRCGYNLTGKSGGSCSECAEQVSADNIRIGIRRRRQASIGSVRDAGSLRDSVFGVTSG